MRTQGTSIPPIHEQASLLSATTRSDGPILCDGCVEGIRVSFGLVFVHIYKYSKKKKNLPTKNSLSGFFKKKNGF